jgi:glycine hydroxymethyltransferase
MRGPRGGLILAKEKWGKSIDSKIFPGIQGGPLVHVISAKAVAFKEAMEPSFTKYQQQVVDNAAALGQNLVDKGFRLVSGGTDNHLLLLDLCSKNITGKEAEELLEQAGLTTNKNAIPFDTEARFVTSGIRVGTPAVTTRGLKTEEMELIAGWIERVLSERSVEVLFAVREEVRALCKRFPLSNIF